MSWTWCCSTPPPRASRWVAWVGGLPQWKEQPAGRPQPAGLPRKLAPTHPFRQTARHPLQVERLLDVYETEGAAGLEGYQVPLLSWDDYQAIRAGGAPAALEAGDAGDARARLLQGKPAGAAGSEQGPAEEAGGGGGEDSASEAGSVDVMEELCELD